jgi:hypothetical protein
VRLVRGGYVVVHPDRIPDPALGALAIRRADGAPFFQRIWDEGGARSRGDPVLEATGTPDCLLGPFPPGPLRLEVRLGQLRLPDVVVNVVAHRVSALSIPLR